MKPRAWLCTFLLLVAGAVAAQEPEAPWDKQLWEMGYHIICTSSINLINGLQLTQDQAVRLRRLAKEVETVALKPPTENGMFSPKLATVRAAYRDLEEVLLKGGEVSKELEGQLQRARAIESAEIRASLAHNPQKTGCAQCHSDPANRDSSAKQLDRTDFNEKAMGAAHVSGPYGALGIARVMKLSAEVEKILTPAQQSMLGDFTCCLVPPKNLKDPARVGQAAVSENKLELLKHVRGVPEAGWPAARKAILKRVGEGLAAAFPGKPEKEREAETAETGKLLDKARALNDVDFELQKDTLAAAMTRRPTVARASSPVSPGFHAATFLLLPGSAQTYDNLTERLKLAEKKPAQQVDLKTISGAENCQDGKCALKGAGNLKPEKKD
ncbi:MAG: hypothetical protein NTW87_33370 [Planctomycetota bacterium]|nr:hypothetical protein [Planctomycetota bacterium]